MVPGSKMSPVADTALQRRRGPLIWVSFEQFSSAFWPPSAIKRRLRETHTKCQTHRRTADHLCLTIFCFCVCLFFGFFFFMSFVPRQSAEHLFGRNNNIWLQWFHNGRERERQREPGSKLRLTTGGNNSAAPRIPDVQLSQTAISWS